jgi:hypothetical protein
VAVFWRLVDRQAGGCAQGLHIAHGGAAKAAQQRVVPDAIARRTVGTETGFSACCLRA